VLVKENPRRIGYPTGICVVDVKLTSAIRTYSSLPIERLAAQSPSSAVGGTGVLDAPSRRRLLALSTCRPLAFCATPHSRKHEPPDRGDPDPEDPPVSTKSTACALIGCHDPGLSTQTREAGLDGLRLE
jgi:hypothetical protein